MKISETIFEYLSTCNSIAISYSFHFLGSRSPKICNPKLRFLQPVQCLNLLYMIYVWIYENIWIAVESIACILEDIECPT